MPAHRTTRISSSRPLPPASLGGGPSISLQLPIASLKGLLDPLRAAHDVRPALRKHADELQKAVTDAGDEDDLHEVLLAEALALALEPELLAVLQPRGLGLAQPPREDDRVVDQRVALARHHVRLREAAQQRLGRQDRRQQEVRCEGWPSVRPDVQDDHRSHHLRRQDPVVEV